MRSCAVREWPLVAPFYIFIPFIFLAGFFVVFFAAFFFADMSLTSFLAREWIREPVY